MDHRKNEKGGVCCLVVLSLVLPLVGSLRQAPQNTSHCLVVNLIQYRLRDIMINYEDWGILFYVLFYFFNRLAFRKQGCHLAAILTPNFLGSN